MFRVILSVALVGSTLFLAGCASDEPKSPAATQTYNTIPWNQPQPGEGAMMGGLMNSH
jgi:hypothetical protein